MEFKVWVDGIERVICGVSSQTTCRDIVLCLAQAIQQFGKFVLIEKWRQNERLLAPNELPIQILNKWGDLSSEVCFIMRRSDLHQQIQQQIQQQQQQQFINNEPLYSTVRPTIYNTNNNVLHPINQMNQINQLNSMSNPLNQQLNPIGNQLNQQINLQPIYYQQGSQLQPNMIYKQNVMKPNFANSQLDYGNQPIYTTKYTTQLPQQQLNLNLNNLNNLNQQLNPQLNQQQFLTQPMLHVQPNNKQILTIHQHSPHNLQQTSPLNQMNQVYGQIQRQVNMAPQQYSPNMIKLNNNLIANQQMINMNQQIIQPQYVTRQELIVAEQMKNNARPRCPPPYNQAIAKSTLLQNNSPGNLYFIKYKEQICSSFFFGLVQLSNY